MQNTSTACAVNRLKLSAAVDRRVPGIVDKRVDAVVMRAVKAIARDAAESCVVDAIYTNLAVAALNATAERAS